MRLHATRLAAIAYGRGLGNPLWDLAGERPSLDLRFAESKSLVDAVSGQSLITFTRASDGTYVGSDGLIKTATTDEPRFDHNPLTGECLGLLVEESRANLLLQSEDFSTTWVPTGLLAFGSGSTANAAAAPDGTTTADLIVESTADSGHFVYQIYPGIVSGLNYTASAYIKPSALRGFAVGFSGAGFNDQSVRFNHLGQHRQTVGTIVSYTIQPLSQGWFRVSVVATAGASGNGQARIFIADTLLGYTGDGTSGIYLWRAQLEAGASPSSSISTTTSAVTRSADLADLISQAIANNIRTLYLEFRSPAVGTRGVVSLNDNTANERASVITSGTDPRLVVVDGGSEQANINGGTITANTRTRVAVRINANDFAISINGGAVVTDTTGTLPTVDRLMLGRTQAGEYLNGALARFTGWEQLLPDSMLQELAR
jgi:hypothetical protein